MASAKCFPSQHLTAAENGLFDVCMRITSGGKNLLLFDGRKMAARFTGVSKDVVYRLTASLVKKGWLVPVNGNGRKRNKSTGMYDATKYRVIEHGYWVVSNGTGQCVGSEPVAPVRMEPFAQSPTTSRKTSDHHSQNHLAPVAPARHSFVKAFEKKPLIEAFVPETQGQTQQQDQKRAPSLSSKKQNQEQPQHPPSEGKRQEPVEGVGDSPRGKSEDSEAEFQKSLSRKAVTSIWHLYPGNERLEDQALSLSQALMIFEAARRDGLKVLNATRAFAAAVKEWPAEEQKRIPPWEQWYSASEYLKDPAEWTPAQDGDSATAGCSSFSGLGQ